MTSQQGIRACFDAVTVNAAKVMHLQGYGLEAGNDASFVLLQQARDAVEAIRLRANRLKVWKKGTLVAGRLRWWRGCGWRDGRRRLVSHIKETA